MRFPLSSYIRTYQIRAECTPIVRGPHACDADGIYWHRCTLHISGPERRQMIVTYNTRDENSAYAVQEIDPEKGLRQVWKSRVSTYAVLHELAREAALYKVARQQVTGFQSDDASSQDEQLWLKAAWLKPKSRDVRYVPECWARIVYQDIPWPPPEELSRLHQETRRMVERLRVFLGGRKDTLPPAYRILLQVDEIYAFVANMLDGVDCT